jgi:hypothetical protein
MTKLVIKQKLGIRISKKRHGIGRIGQGINIERAEQGVSTRITK